MNPARLTLLALGLLALPLPTAATAQQGPAAAEFRAAFLKLDANGDTVLERDEVPEAGRAAFDRLRLRGDANRDGKLDAPEMRALGQKLRALGGPGVAPAARPARLKAMDRNGDGVVSKAEFTGPAPLFDRIDADKDGALTMQEARAFAARAQGPRPKAKQPKEPGAGAPGPTSGGFQKRDLDGDGKPGNAEARRRP